MGNVTSEENKEESILLHPQQGNATDFYWACRHGDFDAVKTIFLSSKFNDINRLELNGSTGLHAAAYFGHQDVVQFLLQNGIFRHRRNRYGLTAYQEAKNDEIRELFHRSFNSRRFSTDTRDDSEQLLITHVEEPTDNNETPEDNWVGGANDETTIRGFQALCNVGKYMVASSILRPLFMNTLRLKDYPDFAYNEKLAVEGLQRIIDKHVTSSHPEYQKASELLYKYEKSRRVEYLLRLYSLETPFYQHLGSDQQSHNLVTPIFFQLDTLKNRAFQGISYRGLAMTEKDLQPYKWALKQKGSIIMTETFCSTSIDQNCASTFIKNISQNKIGVLMVFNFAEKCDTAIQLFTVSQNIPAISDFEDEHEVLILPMTFFHVTNIHINKTNEQMKIYLRNVPTKGGFRTLIKARWNMSHT